MKLNNKNKTYSFVSLFERFIAESKTGKRLQSNGKKISTGTIRNYIYCLKLVERFCREKTFVLNIRDERRLNCRQTQRERNYWKRFYKKFTDYLYNELGFFDNYVGSNIKTLKAFFNYLNSETPIKFGNFHNCFHVRKEEIPVIALLPEELNFLIYDSTFQESLPKRLQEVKDVFVFGCTVALRVSDLLALKSTSLRKINQIYYLTVRSQKTGAVTVIKLPEYCISIIRKYNNRSRKLLPGFNPSNLNQGIKRLLGKAGFTQLMEVQRERRGKMITLQSHVPHQARRFCDLASTHTMRKTAITTMLCLGMPETLVRKISGHAAGSKEFYRYVNWAQSYMDQEIDTIYEKASWLRFFSNQYSFPVPSAAPPNHTVGIF